MTDDSITGARKGQGNFFSRLLTKLAPPAISVLAIPGEEVFRSRQIFLSHLQFELAANPRQANVMLIKGPLSDHLRKYIINAYAQMPRPRVLVFDGLEKLDGLPLPDVVIGKEEISYPELKKRLQQLLSHPFNPNANPYAPDLIKKQLEKTQQQQAHQHGHSHGHEHHQGEGHDHNQHQEHQHQSGDQHHEQEHSSHQHHHKEGSEGDSQQKHQHHQAHESSEHQPQKSEHHHHQHEADQEGHEHHEHHQPQDDQKHKPHQHHQHEHHEHHHGDHDHGGHGGHGGGMGFMSMVMMTKDMPRSTDGLPMEHNQAHFGPFFSGLPGGLSVQMMLDGDTVMQLKPNHQLLKRNLPKPGQLGDLPAILCHYNPLSPETWKIMGEQLLNQASGQADDLNDHQIRRLETERIDSHLNWLISFSHLTGNQWMGLTAEKLMMTRNYLEQRTKLVDFTDQILNFRHLKHKLQGIGRVPEPLIHHGRGIVARAAGRDQDARSVSRKYRNLEFKPLTLNQNDTWGRLGLILKEINQSLQLLHKSEPEAKNKPHTKAVNWQTTNTSATVELEGPFGRLTGNLQVNAGQIEKITITSASGCHLLLAAQVIRQMELSDALNTLASFKINPWELNKVEYK